jgi:hypothetical protein
MEDSNSLPLADLQREETAKQLFSKYKTMSPEEWAARYSHTVLCSSFDNYRYRDPELHEWIHKLHRILRDDSNQIEAYRQKYLTEEERRRINERGDDF